MEMTISVRPELETILATWANSSGIKVAWEGKQFDKPTSSPYVQPFLLPGTTINPTVDGTRQREVGIFQINVWGLDGKGAAETEGLAYQVASLYPIVPKVGTVSIERSPTIGPPFIEAGWRVVPVTILYRREL
jgi:hypothetical protein